MCHNYYFLANYLLTLYISCTVYTNTYTVKCQEHEETVMKKRKRKRKRKRKNREREAGEREAGERDRDQKANNRVS